MDQEKIDFTLCECDLNVLTTFTENHLEKLYQVNITRLPAICLTMVRAEDSVEFQEFYLGEALTTECEVEIEGQTGFGICLGDEPDRAYCLAVFDAVHKISNGLPDIVSQFLDEQYQQVMLQEKREFNQILSTKVDFKLMDQL